MKMKVAIATTSFDKINGIVRAVSRFYHLEENDIEIQTMKVDSNVSSQPFGDETYLGAWNRVSNIREKLKEMDLYISCEAGIETAFEQYFNVHVVCIFEPKSETYFWGKSSGWSIPAKDIEVIKKITLDKYLREKDICCIEQLLGEANSRSFAVEQATELALASKKIL